MSKTNVAYRNPWLWVPSLYFAEGIPYVFVMTVSVVMYKKMGVSNTDIALFTSLLYLPWVIKGLWGPFVDMFKTKRFWVVVLDRRPGPRLPSITRFPAEVTDVARIHPNAHDRWRYPCIASFSFLVVREIPHSVDAVTRTLGLSLPTGPLEACSY